MNHRPTSTNPQLSFSLRSDWLRGRLRADTIRHTTILGLAQAWADDEQAVMDTLDNRAQASTPSPEERDALVQAVEDTTDLGPAHVEIDLATALRMRDELDAMIAKLSRFNPKAATRTARVVHPVREGGAAA
ncbi:MAG TPA: hypothetical protein VFY14_10930 [Streptomyces sp.]|nr:hypothetical protein [Streptomyces sp.]